MFRIISFLKDIVQNEKGLTLAIVGILTGFFTIILYASQASNLTQFASVVGVAFMIACASLLSGGLVGFLFGIPRTLQQDRGEGTLQDMKEKNTSQDKSPGAPYQTNTNLEQISDWLTKILVGVGLTQISVLPKALQDYADYTTLGLGNFSSSKIFSLALLIYFLIGGFLISYLLTRLYLLGAFVQADLAAKFSQVENKVSEFEKQAEIDAKALSIVQRQLNPGTDISQISQEVMNAAIQPASSRVKAQAFYMAHEVRSANWRNRQTKPKMERTIPIFRALIADDTDDIYHANHGQLGFALKDQRKPNWKEAESELTKAIKLRGPWREHGWLFYEFNRAICRINLDGASEQEEQTDEKTKRTILDDLKAASHASEIDKLIADDPTISKWMKINNVRMTEINAYAQ